MQTAPTLFGLIRHGQTDYNLADRFQGSSDIPLNETGREQAHRALDQVPDLGWDRIVSSPLLRARETAQIVSGDHGIPLGEADPRLSEIDWGAAEGVPVGEAEARWPGRSFPDREDAQGVLDRALAALADLARDHPGERILIAAHGTVIRLLATGILGRPLGPLPNGALSLIEVDETGDDDLWRVTMYAGRKADDPPHGPASAFRVTDADLAPTRHQAVRDQRGEGPASDPRETSAAPQVRENDQIGAGTAGASSEHEEAGR